MKSVAFAFALIALPNTALAQEPARDVSIPSGGETMAAKMLEGVGDGPRPAIVLFNGLPAGPNIPKMAFDLQAAGFTVLVPQYRGVGASTGEVSLAGSKQDGTSAVAWLRQEAGESVDSDKIGVLGVSYGGWVAIQTAACDPAIRCVAALVPADMGVIGERWGRDADYRTAWQTDLDGAAADPQLVRFGERGADGFMSDITGDAEASRLTSRAKDLSDRPVFVAGGRRDPAAPFADHYVPLVSALRAAEAPFAALEFDGGHNPSEASAAAQAFIQRKCFAS